MTFTSPIGGALCIIGTAFAIAYIASLLLLPEPAEAKRYKPTNVERMAASQAHAADAAITSSERIAARMNNFCANIGRQTDEEQQKLAVRDDFDHRQKSENDGGTIFVFGPRVEREINVKLRVKHSGRVTCASQNKR